MKFTLAALLIVISGPGCSTIHHKNTVFKPSHQPLSIPDDYKTLLENEYGTKMVRIRSGVWLNTVDINPSKEKTLIFIHGDSGSFDYWLPQINLFKNKYRIVAYERADCGKSITRDFNPTYSNSAENISLQMM